MARYKVTIGFDVHEEVQVISSCGIAEHNDSENRVVDYDRSEGP
jgi:predicted oxidoreductase